MFGDFFGDGDDIVEEIIEEAVVMDVLMSCGSCYNTCTCGYGRAPMRQPLRAQSMQPRLAACGRGCYHGQCSCAGYDPFGNLLEAMIVEEIVEDMFDGGSDFF
jgi:hypothetical protein